MKILGRFLKRDGQNITASLFIPLDKTMEDGVYEISEILGELVIKRIGDSKIEKPRINALDVNELVYEHALITKEEYKSMCSKQ
jgi:hypothetical protein